MVFSLMILHIRDLSESNLVLKVGITLLQEYMKVIFNEKHTDLTAVFRIIHPENIEFIRIENILSRKSRIHPC